MKVLNLIINQNDFDEIISGKKKQEFRTISPTTEKKYIHIDKEGYAEEDENGNSIPIIYDALRLYVGYNKDRDSALVEILKTETFLLQDEDGEIIQEDTEWGTWFAEEIVYDLGKVEIIKRKDRKNGTSGDKKIKEKSKNKTRQ